jgi:membrane protease YdiL (CAAX protease family)
MADSSPQASASRSIQWALVAEVLAFVGLALFSRYLMSLVFWRFAGPVSLIVTIAVLTLYLRARGVGWRSMGLRRLPGLKAKLMVIPQALLTLVAFGVAVALTTIAGPALGLDFLAKVPDGVAERWGAVTGDLPLYLTWVAISWTAAAFGEEMFFRGYMITRLQAALPAGRLGSAAAVLLPAAIFGYSHFYYQGLRGVFVTGAIALAFGTMFLVFKRNLWPMILLHGFVDTLSFTALYLGKK